MYRKIAVAALLTLTLAGCSGGAPANETLTEMCVRLSTAVYEKHGLPFTDYSESEQASACDDWMDENGVDSKAEMIVASRMMDKVLRSLNS